MKTLLKYLITALFAGSLVAGTVLVGSEALAAAKGAPSSAPAAMKAGDKAKVVKKHAKKPAKKKVKKAAVKAKPVAVAAPAKK